MRGRVVVGIAAVILVGAAGCGGGSSSSSGGMGGHGGAGTGGSAGAHGSGGAVGAGGSGGSGGAAGAGTGGVTDAGADVSAVGGMTGSGGVTGAGGVTGSGGSVVDAGVVTVGCPTTINGALETTDPVQTGRESRTLTPAVCGFPKAFPGTGADPTNPHFYDGYRFVNPSGASACFTFTLTYDSGSVDGSAGVQRYLTAYSSYDPTNIGNAYLGDVGSTLTSPQTMSITVPAGSSIDVVVFAIDIAPAGAGSYTLSCATGTGTDGGVTTDGGGGSDGGGGAGGNGGAADGGDDSSGVGGSDGGGNDASDAAPDA